MTQESPRIVAGCFTYDIVALIERHTGRKHQVGNTRPDPDQIQDPVYLEPRDASHALLLAALKFLPLSEALGLARLPEDDVTPTSVVQGLCTLAFAVVQKRELEQGGKVSGQPDWTLELHRNALTMVAKKYVEYTLAHVAGMRYGIGRQGGQLGHGDFLNIPDCCGRCAMLEQIMPAWQTCMARPDNLIAVAGVLSKVTDPFEHKVTDPFERIMVQYKIMMAVKTSEDGRSFTPPDLVTLGEIFAGIKHD